MQKLWLKIIDLQIRKLDCDCLKSPAATSKFEAAQTKMLQTMATLELSVRKILTWRLTARRQANQAHKPTIYG